jgi:hypothetical protein
MSQLKKAGIKHHSQPIAPKSKYMPGNKVNINGIWNYKKS